MEMQSRRRRAAPMPEPQLIPPVARNRRPRPLLILLLFTSFLALFFLLLPENSFSSWTTPSLHHQQFNEVVSRPRIVLHPDDHVYRPTVTQYFNWSVTSGLRRPDGVLKRIYLINDLFPGPTIEARSGDTLIITVTNDLSEDPITIHWHGLHIANDMDGATGVTQSPIVPGGRFVYNLTIPSDQSGTFWYHAHAASKSAIRGLWTRNRSDAQRFGYEKELLLLIGDWYHRPAKDVLAWYMTPGNFGNEPVPDSLLINGAGYFDCSMAVPARPLDCIEQDMNSSLLHLDPDTAYRIRVVNTGALAGFSLILDKENFDIVQMDSVDVARDEQQPDINSAGILHPGQRMDFVLRQPLHDYDSSVMTVQLDEGCFKYVNPALTPLQSFPIIYKSTFQKTILTPETRKKINLEKIPSSPAILKSLPRRADQTQVVYTKIQKLARNHNIPFGYFNQTTWKPQKDPFTPLRNLPRSQWDSNQLSFSTPDAAWIDLVVNNLDEGPHPFHLHGHHFYILAIQEPFGWGSYSPFEDIFPPGLEPDEHNDANEPYQPYDLAKASLRDTVQIPSRGYAVLRFRADNPGVWLFHCHILWHMATGMAMLVDVQGDPAGQIAHASG
ncbi:multicopper oxidase-domain-containing protein [Penicillium taxi]|uniref:multicopper oxidase-domain-containing protein n=1 Tax=Penicillium taxi TaxID=168475 RepID=UPI002544D6E9|nr:multicopper oxidase-domain-containing protein [Penicillium taxi]KAJ5901666.1 multicopper oxidase-domain-containing protein [Penicillium taxi]